MVTFATSSLGENKTKLKKVIHTDFGFTIFTISAFVCYLEDFIPMMKID